ncbi:hypothetical protein GCM10011428_69840 [Streptomyces violaceus]
MLRTTEPGARGGPRKGAGYIIRTVSMRVRKTVEKLTARARACTGAAIIPTEL